MSVRRNARTSAMRIFGPFISLLLSLPLVFGETGYWLYADIYQYVLKAEIREMICEISPDDGQLVSLRFPADANERTGFVWTKGDEEFLYGGEMYDIVRTSTARDSVTYFCFRDVNENSYRLKLVNMASQEQNPLGSITLPAQVLCFQFLSAQFIYRYDPQPAASFSLIPPQAAEPLHATDPHPPRSKFS